MDDKRCGTRPIAYEKHIIKWAHTYDGYTRLAGTEGTGLPPRAF